MGRGERDKIRCKEGRSLHLFRKPLGPSKVFIVEVHKEGDFKVVISNLYSSFTTFRFLLDFFKM